MLNFNHVDSTGNSGRFVSCKCSAKNYMQKPAIISLQQQRRLSMDKLLNIAKQIDRNDENINIQITAIKNLIDQIGSLQDYAGSFEETQFGSAAMQLKSEIDNTIPRIQDVLVQNDNLIQKMMDLFFELDAGPHLDKLSQEFGKYQETHLEVSRIFYSAKAALILNRNVI